MSTTIDDVHYETYLEDLKKDYIKSLEKFATSKNVSEMKENYEELMSARLNIEEWMTETNSKDFNYLEETLSNLKGIEDVYKKLELDSKNAKTQFVIGLILSLVGLILTFISFI